MSNTALDLIKKQKKQHLANIDAVNLLFEMDEDFNPKTLSRDLITLILSFIRNPYIAELIRLGLKNELNLTKLKKYLEEASVNRNDFLGYQIDGLSLPPLFIDPISKQNDLQIAVMLDRLDLIDFLLSQRKDVPQNDGHGFSTIAYEVLNPENETTVSKMLDLTLEPVPPVSTGFGTKHFRGLNQKSNVSFTFPINAAVTPFGDTLLHLAILLRNKKLIELVLSRKPDINQQNNLGATPLHTAVEIRYLEGVEILLKALPKLNLLNKDGFTALQVASICNFHEIENAIKQKTKALTKDLWKMILETIDDPKKLSAAEELVEIGIPLNRTEITGKTILHFACYNRPKFVVEWLVKKCPDLIIVGDRDGFLPITYAQKNTDKTVLAFVISKSLQDSRISDHTQVSIFCRPKVYSNIQPAIISSSAATSLKPYSLAAAVASAEAAAATDPAPPPSLCNPAALPPRRPVSLTSFSHLPPSPKMYVGMPQSAASSPTTTPSAVTPTGGSPSATLSVNLFTMNHSPSSVSVASLDSSPDISANSSALGTPGVNTAASAQTPDPKLWLWQKFLHQGSMTLPPSSKSEAEEAFLPPSTISNIATNVKNSKKLSLSQMHAENNFAQTPTDDHFPLPPFPNTFSINVIKPENSDHTSTNSSTTSHSQNSM